MSGYIRLHRKIMKNPIWTQMPAERLKVWFTILMRANYRSSKIWCFKQRREIDVPAGTLLTSYEDLVGKSSCSVKQIRLALEYLKGAHMIAISRHSKGMLITVLNWSTYQPQGQDVGVDEGSDAGIDAGVDEGTERAGEGQARGNIKEVKEINTSTGDDPSPSDSGDQQKKRKVSKRTVKTYAPEVEWLSERLLGRHPEPRSIGPKECKDCVEKILNQYDKSERQSVAESINENHAAWCRTEQWKKCGGEFAKGLDNWLAPTKGRFLRPVPTSAIVEDQPVFRLMM